jgi:MerR family transcriptional regulator, light-induced transcriptional regulator
MQTFSIRDIENLSGIKAHTLRIWEQRYKLIMPARKESRHRLYSNEDLKQILRISYLYHHGYKISAIARMTPEQINTQSLEYSRHTSYEVFINQFVEAALDLDEQRFDEVFRGLFLHLGFERGMIQVVYPYLEKIGMLWMTGNLLPAQEHFSSQLVRKQILLDTAKITVRPAEHAEHLLIFAPKGEFHEIPLLLIVNFLRKAGFRVAYFGVNVDLEALVEYQQKQAFSGLYMHLLTNFTELRPDEYITSLANQFPGKRIYVSGPVARELTVSPPGLHLLHSILDVKNLKPGSSDQPGNT